MGARTRHHRLPRLIDDRERGQATIEYVGITLLMAVLIAVLLLKLNGKDSAVDQMIGSLANGIGGALDRMHVT